VLYDSDLQREYTVCPMNAGVGSYLIDSGLRVGFCELYQI
jgi:hypothetical protein